ncbi:tyrosine-type recombinase/integrase [Enterococcus faecium]|uniref:tyrosine-type recombinase/integrase n=1 Tax=Enterococcus faecium TaxID=1352 RepID=UPI0021FCB457|nr:tyrosine-type recombinase/integrase [Enterococcus faecium]BDP97636.1 integrase [Enterococcus faecium]
MDSKTRKQLQEKLKQRTHLLPSVFQQFLEENRSSLSLGSRYEYAKDFHLFTDYLRKVFSEEVEEQLIIHLEKQDYQNFLAKIYRHTRSFQTTANQETEQLFVAAFAFIFFLLGFITLQILNQSAYRETDLSLEKINFDSRTVQLEIQRYQQGDPFLNPTQTFIPIEGFQTSREASFEEKNRPRNLAITAILLYCGLKIHEVVELKRKDVSLTKQILNLNRKENRLNKVPIPKEAMPFLENYFKLTAQNTDENSFVFRSSHDQQISPRTIRQILSKITVYKNVSPELCRKTYRYYAELYLDDADAVNYLCGNRYLSSHSFQDIWEKMVDFSYHELAAFVRVSSI